MNNNDILTYIYIYTVFPRIVRALRIDRALELIVHNANGEINRPRANYSRKYGIYIYTCSSLSQGFI